METIPLHSIIFEGGAIAPSKIVCVGRNYAEHAKELDNEIPTAMVLFVKPNSAISQALVSFHEEPLHYEAELSFLVKDRRFCAVGLGIDLTKRTLQSRLKKAGLPWERAKAFDGAAVFSPFVALPASTAQLGLELHINGELAQRGHVGQMLFTPEQVLAECQSFMSLYDGDIVMTGTPSGVGVVNRGDEFRGLVFDGRQELLSARWRAG